MQLAQNGSITLNEDEQTGLERQFAKEIDDVSSIRNEFERLVAMWEDAYEAKPESAERTFPWKKACNVVVPLISIACDGMVARLLGTLIGVEPFWTVRSHHSKLVKPLKTYEQYLETVKNDELQLHDTLFPWADEIVRLGTGFVKGVPVEEDGEFMVRLAHVPLLDLFFLPTISKLSKAQWISHRLYKSMDELEDTKEKYAYSNLDRVATLAPNPTDYEKKKRQLEGTSNFPPEYEPKHIFERWGVVDFGGQKVNCIATFAHTEGNAILMRITENILPGRRNPFFSAVLKRRIGKVYGIGVAKRLMPLQDALTAQLRQTVDNGTLANTRFFKAKEGAVLPGTQVYPGKFLFLANPTEDVIAEQLGEIYPSTYNTMLAIEAWAEKVVGLNDFSAAQGQSILSARSTAAATIAGVQESYRRVDLAITDIRKMWADIGEWVMHLHGAYNEKGKIVRVMGDKGVEVEQVLALSAEDLAYLTFEVATSTAALNREMEKQSNLALLQQLTVFYKTLFDMMMMVGQPTTPISVKAFAFQVAGTVNTMLEKVLKSFDVRDIDQLLINPQPFVGMEVMQSAQQGAALPPGAGPGMAGVGGGAEGAQGGPPGNGGVGGNQGGNVA